MTAANYALNDTHCTFGTVSVVCLKYLAVTSRVLTTISLLPKIVYGSNSNRARSGAKNASRLGDWIFSIISGDSERKCTGCTLSERPHERTEKDIPKVVSDGKINPTQSLFKKAQIIAKMPRLHYN